MTTQWLVQNWVADSTRVCTGDGQVGEGTRHQLHPTRATHLSHQLLRSGRRTQSHSNSHPIKIHSLSTRNQSIDHHQTILSTRATRSALQPTQSQPTRHSPGATRIHSHLRPRRSTRLTRQTMITTLPLPTRTLSIHPSHRPPGRSPRASGLGRMRTTTLTRARHSSRARQPPRQTGRALSPSRAIVGCSRRLLLRTRLHARPAGHPPHSARNSASAPSTRRALPHQPSREPQQLGGQRQVSGG